MVADERADAILFDVTEGRDEESTLVTGDAHTEVNDEGEQGT